MNQSIYTAARGIIAQQQRVDNIANNIANINTPGLKTCAWTLRMQCTRR